MTTEAGNRPQSLTGTSAHSGGLVLDDEARGEPSGVRLVSTSSHGCRAGHNQIGPPAVPRLRRARSRRLGRRSLHLDPGPWHTIRSRASQIRTDTGGLQKYLHALPEGDPKKLDALARPRRRRPTPTDQPPANPGPLDKKAKAMRLAPLHHLGQTGRRCSCARSARSRSAPPRTSRRARR